MTFFTLRFSPRITLVLLALATVFPAVAQQTLASAQSEIGFTFKQMGVPVDGKFKKFDANFVFDANKLTTSKVVFTVDLNSASIGDPATDAELPKTIWFNAAKFPQATFASNSIKALGAGKFEVSGRLNIKGVAQEVIIPVSMMQANNLTTAIGMFPIKRLSFKIGENEWADTAMLADPVQVKFKLVLNGVGKL